MRPDFSRYSCQIALPGFTEAAQQQLQQARVLIVGAGGLGCPAAQYLAASGIGTLGIADFDTVSTSNLHRQVLYNPSDVGLQKAVLACEGLQKQNPGIKSFVHFLADSEHKLQSLLLQIFDDFRLDQIKHEKKWRLQIYRQSANAYTYYFLECFLHYRIL